VYFVIAGGGQVGFHLAQALIEAGHEVMIIEEERRRAQWIQDQLGNIVLTGSADEGRFLLEAGCQRADAVIGATGDDPVNLVVCQMAQIHCRVPRVIARVNDPKNEIVFKKLGIEETVSSTRVLMSVIEQELPMRGFVPIMPLVTAGLEIVEAEIAEDSPSAGKPLRELRLPDGATVGGIVRKRALVPARPEERVQPGDRLIAFTPTAAEPEVRKALVG
jgi:trk system potassium uptake protein TrkA